MRLDLPKSFDANEWFLIISLIVMVAVTVPLSRRFPFIVTVVLYSIGPSIAMNVDFLLGAPPINIYSINDTGRYELFDLLLYFLYAPFSYLYIYFYSKWNVRGIGISLYVLGCSLIAVAYEWVAVLCDVFTYNRWNLGYSFIVYVVIQSIYLGLTYYFRQTYNACKKSSAPNWP